MRIDTTRVEISTDEGVSIADITAEVNDFVRSSGIVTGLCVMTVDRHECFLSLAPDLDEAFDDLLRLVREAGDADLRRSAGDPAASDRADFDTTGNHAPPGFLAESLSFSVRDGAPDLGSWDAIVLVDAGGPARRAVEITVMGPARASAGT
jgi:thiamine phosphate synthase YjbQ (UPF0047 family)